MSVSCPLVTIKKPETIRNCMNGTFFVTMINDFINEKGKTGDSHPQAEQNDGFSSSHTNIIHRFLINGFNH